MAVKILSIDGGGTRGLFPVSILKEIERDTHKKITDLFDVIIGSATGGIIVCNLAAGISVEKIQNIYLNRAEKILPKNTFRQFPLFNPLSFFRAKYSNEGLYDELKTQIGEDLTMGDVFSQFGEKPIFLMPALDLNPYLEADEVPGFKPVIFNSVNAKDKNLKLIDVAMRTSAAPINLPIYQQFAEGGNYANDPCVFGLSFALNDSIDKNNAFKLSNNKMGLGQKPADVKLLSLGCGSTGASYVPEKHLKKSDWGLLKWQRYLISLVIDSNMVANKYLTQEILPEENYLRINAYYKDESAPEILRNTKLRIDVRDKAQLDAIKDYAEETYTLNKNNILEFINPL